MNDKRRFTRVACNIQASFRLDDDDGIWYRGSAMDLSAVGMKLSIRHEQSERVFRSCDIARRTASFKFAGRDNFILRGKFLSVYLEKGGRLVSGVIFRDLSPEEQFMIVNIYSEYKKWMSAIVP